MNRMFNRASSFNGDLSSWDVSIVADMGWMFMSQILMVIYLLGMFLV